MRAVSVLSLLGALLAAPPACRADSAGVGKTIANFELHDYLGTPHALAELAKSKLVLVAFLGTDCPLANRYAGRLVELSTKNGPRGGPFAPISPNPHSPFSL